MPMIYLTGKASFTVLLFVVLTGGSASAQNILQCAKVRASFHEDLLRLEGHQRDYLNHERTYASLLPPGREHQAERTQAIIDSERSYNDFMAAVETLKPSLRELRTLQCEAPATIDAFETRVAARYSNIKARHAAQ
jgi:hypothetical protein